MFVGNVILELLLRVIFFKKFVFLLWKLFLIENSSLVFFVNWLICDWVNDVFVIKGVVVSIIVNSDFLKFIIFFLFMFWVYGIFVYYFLFLLIICFYYIKIKMIVLLFYENKGEELIVLGCKLVSLKGNCVVCSLNVFV